MTPEELSALNKEITLLKGYRFGLRENCGGKECYRGPGEAWWYEGDPYGESELPNWTSDENAMKLLKEMSSPTLALETLHAPKWACWPESVYLNPGLCGRDEEPGTAIALAYREWRRGK